MEEKSPPHGAAELAPLRRKIVDDGEIRLGPARVEPLTAAQEALAVKSLAALFAAARRRDSATRLRRPA